MQTYLLIRNGEKVYRIASAVDFSPRLIPKLDEIGEKQFQKIHKPWSSFAEDQSEKIETITPDDIRYDSCVEKLDRDIKHYNRVVVLLQGLLDRSDVFSPHPRVNLCKPDSFEQWVKLIRDEEHGLLSSQISWEEYKNQLNHKIKPNAWVYVDQNALSEYKERNSNRKYSRCSYDYWSNSMPQYIKVSSVSLDRKKVKVSWPQGKNRYNEPTDKMYHETVPIEFVFPVDAYTPGDYRMFLFNHEMKVEYRKWASYLLSAEDWVQKKKFEYEQNKLS